MRLIDADALLKKKDIITINDGNRASVVGIVYEDDIEEAPTIDAVPVVHGEWIVDGMNEYELSYGCIGYEPRYRCSNCGITTESYLRTEKPIMPEDADFPRYCQYCGAKMDGKEKEDG